MLNTKPVLCRDVETGKVYADPKTNLVIGRLKHKTISAYYGMHQEPVFCLQFEVDEFEKPIVLHSDWQDKLNEVAEPTKTVDNPQIKASTRTTIDENTGLEQGK